LAAVLDLVGTLAELYDLLLSRKTYDIFAGFWPNAPADNRIGPVFRKVNKYVLTGGSAKLKWDNSHQLRNLDELKKVKAEEGSDIALRGSSTPLSAPAGCQSYRPPCVDDLSDRSRKGQKNLWQHQPRSCPETNEKRGYAAGRHHGNL